MTEKISYQALPVFYSNKHLLKTYYENTVLGSYSLPNIMRGIQTKDKDNLKQEK